MPSSVGPVRLADTLGWASSALGAPMTVAPRRFLSAIGVEDDARAVGWTLAVGVREHLATIQVIAMRQRRIGMWARVAGDSMDLALLAAAARTRAEDPDRVRAATGLVAALLALDLLAAVGLSRAEGVLTKDGSDSPGVGVEHDTGGGPTRVRTAVTIRRPVDEVARAFAAFDWSAFDPAALVGAGEVHFVPAPGERGTELHLDHEPGSRGGPLGAAAAKVLGQSPDQAIHDELRRFKALVETGVLARSETSPEGPTSARQILHKRPAQPVGEE